MRLRLPGEFLAFLAASLECSRGGGFAVGYGQSVPPLARQFQNLTASSNVRKAR